jgi:hypothetical protein
MTKRLRNHNRSWGNGDEPAGHGEVEMSKPSPHLWTAEDEDQLRWMVTAGKNVEMIAAQLNRKPICSARKGLQTEPFAWLFWVDETKVICLRRTPRKRSESRDRLRAVFLFVLQVRLSILRNSLAVETPLAVWPGSTRVRLNRASSHLAGL